MRTEPFPDKVTYGEAYGPAMSILAQDEADAYFELLIEHHMRIFGGSREQAETKERQSLGYYAGYYSDETQQRVNRLFKTTHPVFGDTTPTPEEAFEMGRNM